MPIALLSRHIARAVGGTNLGPRFLTLGKTQLSHTHERKSHLMKKRIVAAVGVFATLAAALTGCSGGGTASASSCTNTIVQDGAPQVTVWAWYPAFQDVVDQFNNTHTDVQVCWSNAGQGLDEYSKFSTAIQAKTGAPDVIMLENEVLPTFTAQNALEDLTSYGANDVKTNYTAGAWKDVSSGSGVYAIPVDAGPVGFLYRKDIFDKYGITVPKTWDEYAEDAQKLKDAGFSGVIGNYQTNGTAFNVALFAQAGAELYSFDSSSPTTVGIDVDNAATVKVLSFWNDLIQKGLVSADDSNTSDWTTKMVSGGYASYIVASWGSGYLQGASGADEDAVWQAAPLPQWDAKNPVQVNQGGSSFAVTTQAKDKALSAEVAKEIFGTQDAWKIGIEKGALFPTYGPILNSTYFAEREDPFFSNQQTNKEVFIPAAQAYTGYTFLPFQTYAYDQQTQAFSAVAKGTKSPTQALTDLQDTLVNYAKQQGFTVK